MLSARTFSINPTPVPKNPLKVYSKVSSPEKKKAVLGQDQKPVLKECAQNHVKGDQGLLPPTKKMARGLALLAWVGLKIGEPPTPTESGSPIGFPLSRGKPRGPTERCPVVRLPHISL